MATQTNLEGVSMKKLLLGTTALVGALVLGTTVAPQASAQAVTGNKPFNVSISGFAQFSANIAGVNRTSNAKSYNFRQDSEVHFVFTGKADNGLTYGYRAEFEMDRGPANTKGTVDESSIFFQGNWGRVELGNNDAPILTDSVLTSRTSYGFGDGAAGYESPLWAQIVNSKINGSIGFGGASRAVTGLIPSHLTDLQASFRSSDSTKASYLSPSFSGFQFSLAFTPSGDTYGRTNTLSKTTTLATAGNTTHAGLANTRDIIEAAARYNGKFGDVGVNGVLTYTYANVDEARQTTAFRQKYDEFNSLGAGLGITAGGFAVSGTVIWEPDSGLPRYANALATTSSAGTAFTGAAAPVRGYSSDTWGVSLAADYAIGPWALGLNYMYSTREGSILTAANQKLTQVRGGATYTLAPGLRMFGDLTYYYFKNDNMVGNQALAGTSSNDRDAKGVVFLAGTQVKF